MAFSVTSVNVNGIRAAVKQRNEDNPGMIPWLGQSAGATFILLQEVRATEDQARTALAPALGAGWHLSMIESAVKGHAGVGILSTVEPLTVHHGFDSDEFDGTGRYIDATFATTDDSPELTLASVYVPKGAADGDKCEEKKRFLAEFADHMGVLLAGGGDVAVAGDWNIAHTENDIKNWKGNLKSPGFLPHERSWVTELLEAGWVDVARDHHGDVDGPYSWWSWRGKAFDTGAGWRIDYHLTSPALAERVQDVFVDKAPKYAQRWSDHAPVVVKFT